MIRPGRAAVFVSLIGFLLSTVIWSAARALSPPLTLSATEVTLTVRAAEPFVYKIWKANSPPRFVIDFADNPQKRAGSYIASQQKFQDVLVKQLRREPGPDGGTRLVLDLAYPVVNWDETGWVQAADGTYVLSLKVPRRFVQQQNYPVTPSVRLSLQHRGELYGPVTVDILIVQVHDPQVRVDLALAKGGVTGLESVLSIAKRKGALAAVNATYFHDSGLPLGLMVSDGLLISPSIYDRSAFIVMSDGSYGIGRAATRMKLVLADGSALAVNGLNRSRKAGEIVVYNEAFGAATPKTPATKELVVRDGRVVAVGTGGTSLTAGTIVVAGDASNARLNLAAGEPLQFVWSLYLLDSRNEVPGEQIWLALGAGPRLVQGGKVKVTSQEEQFRSDVTQGRAPRTALGITAEGYLLLVAVNGRQKDVSEGMSLEELAALLTELGAVEAINLDGGGSTTMVVRDRVINMPSAGERAVASALLIYSPAP